MARLIGRLSPSHSPDMHTVVAELIKNIISMAAPSPGAGLTEGLSNGPASNRFARELAQRDNVQTLVEYILDDFSGVQKVEEKDEGSGRAPVKSVEVEQKDAKGKDKDKENMEEDEGMKDDDESDHDPPDVLPSLESSTSSVVNSICIIIELIRQNNSDYFEPYLFHTLRNRLIQIQQQLQPPTAEESRETLERSMREMVDRMGVVHLGPVLEIFCDRLDQVHKYLKAPRSLVSAQMPTVIPFLSVTVLIYAVDWTRLDDTWKHHTPHLRTIPHLRALRRAFALLQYVPPQPTSRIQLPLRLRRSTARRSLCSGRSGSCHFHECG